MQMLLSPAGIGQVSRVNGNHICRRGIHGMSNSPFVGLAPGSRFWILGSDAGGEFPIADCLWLVGVLVADIQLAKTR
jgi:hypothetical protein